MSRKTFAALALFSICCASFSQEPIKKAIQDNDMATLKTLVDADPGLLDKEIEFGSYPLLYASGLIRDVMVKYLLEKGAKADVKSSQKGETAITRIAANLDNLPDERVKRLGPMLELLAEKKADFTAAEKNGKGPLLILSERFFSPERTNNIVEIAKLFQKHGAKFSDPGNKGCLIALASARGTTTLASGKYGELEAIPGFIELGADVNDVDKETGNTALTALIANSSIPEKSKVETLKLLIEKGAKTNIKLKNGKKAADLIKKDSPLEEILKKTKAKK